MKYLCLHLQIKLKKLLRDLLSAEHLITKYVRLSEFRKKKQRHFLSC